VLGAFVSKRCDLRCANSRLVPIAPVAEAWRLKFGIRLYLNTSAYARQTMSKRIFVDVSNIIRVDLHTGIQRVIREVTKSFVKPENGFDIELIAFKFTPLETIRIAKEDLPWLATDIENVLRSDRRIAAETQAQNSLSGLFSTFAKSAFFRAKIRLAQSIGNARFTHFLVGSARERGTLNAYLTLGRLVTARSTHGGPGIEAEIRPGDVVLLLDASWDVQNFRTHLERFKRLEATIVAVIYDVIPLSHAHYVVPGLTSNFLNALDAIVYGADRIVTISASELITVKQYVSQEPALKERKTPLKFGYFHLGCNVPATAKNDVNQSVGLPDRFLALGSGALERACIFLCVGTVEPRKNIDLVLDAFFQVWLKRRDVMLVLVGKPGWKTEKLQKRIEEHPLLNQNIFWSTSLNDAGLMWLYNNSDFLLQASITEGFGLPIVEAMVAGKQILCSDIPVFHEVAGDKAIYFDHTEAQSLSAKVNSLSDLPRGNRNVTPNRSAWITWDESAKQLFELIYTKQ
jgi:glycosyltransferase involved in cell wall biosynthesis